jgi:hypothetical protein
MGDRLSENKNVSRRGFLKGAAAATAGISAMTLPLGRGLCIAAVSQQRCQTFILDINTLR